MQRNFIKTHPSDFVTRSSFYEKSLTLISKSFFLHASYDWWAWCCSISRILNLIHFILWAPSFSNVSPSHTFTIYHLNDTDWYWFHSYPLSACRDRTYKIVKQQKFSTSLLGPPCCSAAFSQTKLQLPTSWAEFITYASRTVVLNCSSSLLCWLFVCLSGEAFSSQPQQ